MKLLFTLLFCGLCLFGNSHPQIKPAQRFEFVSGGWGYKDLSGNWIIPPTFAHAYDFTEDGIARVSISGYTMGFIDFNGNVLVEYKYNDTQKRRDRKYKQAIDIVSDRKSKGLYNDVYARFARVDSDIMEQQRIERDRKMRERARQDSILMAQRLLKTRSDSIAAANRAAENLRLAKEREIMAIISSGPGISLRKIKVTGHGLLLSKDETWREYTILLDDFNRLRITHEAEARLRGELNVLKVIHESDWGLLSDNLFRSIDITKATVKISQGTRTKNFGVFSFFVILNIDDLNIIYTNEEAKFTALTAVSQLERYIASFINHYQSSAHFVEPLLNVHVGGYTEGIMVGVADKQSNGALMEDVKRACNESVRIKFKKLEP